VRLGERITEREAQRFVGRDGELAVLERLFADDPPYSVVHVHGPGGIGKSALLRQAAAEGERRGWTTYWVEGRDLPPTPEALTEALEPALDAERPLVLLDTYERMSATSIYLRDVLLPGLPARGAVIIAGRTPPDAGWFSSGWETVTTELALGGLDEGLALALVSALGVSDAETAARIVRWAHGSPLALRLGADAQVAGAVEDAVEPTAHKEVVASLIRRVVAAELEGAHPRALATATIARVVTPDLLSAAMAQEGDPATAYAWLRSRSFVEPLGRGLTLHEVVRRAMLVDLTLKDPALEHELRRRIADHLHARAVAGDSLLMIDLAHLVEDPVVRWGFSWEGSARFRVDTMGPGDAVTINQLMAVRGVPGWYEMTQGILEEAPEVPIVVRGIDGRIHGHALSVTPAGAPAAADDDPVLGPWLAHARAQEDRRAVIWRESLDHTQEPEQVVQAMIGLACMLRSGLSNVRYAYMPIPPGADRALQFAQRLGARRERSLDTRYGTAPIECWILDYGPGGLLGMQRDVVYRELGLTPPSGPAEPASAGPVDAEAVRAALRDFHKPVDLARSPLASGTTPVERAESVRDRLRAAIEQAFGSSPDEQLLRAVLERGYLAQDTSLESAALELHLSRATYFRRLKRAVDRVVAVLAN
jgi:hypothetical protein